MRKISRAKNVDQKYFIRVLNTIGKLNFTTLKEKKYTNCKKKKPTYTPECKSRIKFWKNHVKKELIIAKRTWKNSITTQNLIYFRRNTQIARKSKKLMGGKEKKK